MLLTEKEQDKAVKDAINTILKPVLGMKKNDLSKNTIKFLSYDAISKAQHDKDMKDMLQCPRCGADMMCSQYMKKQFDEALQKEREEIVEEMRLIKSEFDDTSEANEWFDFEQKIRSGEFAPKDNQNNTISSPSDEAERV